MTEHEWLTCQHSPDMRNFLYFKHKELENRVKKWFPEKVGYAISCGDSEWEPPADARRCDIIREVVGNPFRPVEFEQPKTLHPCPHCRLRGRHCPLCYGSTKIEASCGTCHDAKQVWTGMDGMKWVPCVKCKDWLPKSWLTSTVLSIAQAIVERGCYEEMPILADALEEAGCDNEEILQHCRGMVRCPECQPRKKVHRNPLSETTGWSLCPNDGWLPKPVPCLPGCWVLRLILDSTEQ